VEKSAQAKRRLPWPRGQETPKPRLEASRPQHDWLQQRRPAARGFGTPQEFLPAFHRYLSAGVSAAKLILRVPRSLLAAGSASERSPPRREVDTEAARRMEHAGSAALRLNELINYSHRCCCFWEKLPAGREIHRELQAPSGAALFCLPGLSDPAHHPLWPLPALFSHSKPKKVPDFVSVTISITRPAP